MLWTGWVGSTAVRHERKARITSADLKFSKWRPLKLYLFPHLFLFRYGNDAYFLHPVLLIVDLIRCFIIRALVWRKNYAC